MREEVKLGLPSSAAVLGLLCDAAFAATWNLGLRAHLAQIAPEHWQRVLTTVETRMRVRGVALPEGWREALAEQMNRVGADSEQRG
ncbi:hypothetical protein ACRAWG_39425 (plasmid) [Methylobacterium sp. P31]